ncbi:MAG: biopolymer transporter ExbD [Proteiniphilum sp.]|nr:biopolymer transporter ExbD [Proteiniphilum sp.]
MAKTNRKVPALNASSMADISFLLLTFFLLVSNMDVDSGLARRLPPPPQSEEQTSVDVQRRNLLVVLVNAQNETLVQNQVQTQLYSNERELRGDGGKVALKEMVKEFVLNTQNSSQLPELTEEDFGAPIGTVPVTAQHVISIQNDATTSYKAYIAVQNEVVRAYNELREEGAKRYFNTSYGELSDEQQRQINDLYPQRISEAEPKNYGGN